MMLGIWFWLGCGQGGESGETKSEGLDEASFVVSGEYEGAALALYAFQASQAGYSVGTLLSSVPVSASAFSVPLPTPPEAELIETDPTGAPGMRAGSYLYSMYQDSSGDSSPSAGELFVGVGESQLVFVSGTIPADYQDLGVEAGWNRLDVGGEGAFTVVSMSDIPIATPYWPMNTLALGGTTSFAGKRIAIISEVATGSTPLYDEASVEVWSASVSGAPSAEYLSEATLFGAKISVGIPIVYDDVDTSGGFNTGDVVLSQACLSGTPAFLAYVQLESLGALMDFAGLGGTSAGWVLVTDLYSAPEVQSVEAALSLRFDASCE